MTPSHPQCDPCDTLPLTPFTPTLLLHFFLLPHIVMSTNTAASSSQGGNATATVAGNATPSGGQAPPPGTATPATAGQRRYDIPFLEEDRSNYDAWQCWLAQLLKLCKLWNMVNGTYTHPDGTDASTLADWVTINEEAHARIEFTIKDSGPLNTVADAISAKDTWNKLSERYASKGTQH